MARQLNRELLKKQIDENGLARVSLSTDVSLSTLEKMRAGTYKSQISHKTMGKICKGLRTSIDILFPDTEALKRKAS